MGRKERGRGELCYTRIDILGYVPLLTNDREREREDGERGGWGWGALLHKDLCSRPCDSSYELQREDGEERDAAGETAVTFILVFINLLY